MPKIEVSSPPKTYYPDAPWHSWGNHNSSSLGRTHQIKEILAKDIKENKGTSALKVGSVVVQVAAVVMTLFLSVASLYFPNLYWLPWIGGAGLLGATLFNIALEIKIHFKEQNNIARKHLESSLNASPHAFSLGDADLPPVDERLRSDLSLRDELKLRQTQSSRRMERVIQEYDLDTETVARVHSSACHGRLEDPFRQREWSAAVKNVRLAKSLLREGKIKEYAKIVHKTQREALYFSAPFAQHLFNERDLLFVPDKKVEDLLKNISNKWAFAEQVLWSLKKKYEEASSLYSITPFLSEITKRKESYASFLQEKKNLEQRIRALDPEKLEAFAHQLFDPMLPEELPIAERPTSSEMNATASEQIIAEIQMFVLYAKKMEKEFSVWIVRHAIKELKRTRTLFDDMQKLERYGQFSTEVNSAVEKFQKIKHALLNAMEEKTYQKSLKALTEFYDKEALKLYYKIKERPLKNRCTLFCQAITRSAKKPFRGTTNTTEISLHKLLRKVDRDIQNLRRFEHVALKVAIVVVILLADSLAFLSPWVAVGASCALTGVMVARQLINRRLQNLQKEKRALLMEEAVRFFPVDKKIDIERAILPGQEHLLKQIKELNLDGTARTLTRQLTLGK